MSLRGCFRGRQQDILDNPAESSIGLTEHRGAERALIHRRELQPANKTSLCIQRSRAILLSTHQRPPPPYTMSPAHLRQRIPQAGLPLIKHLEEVAPARIAHPTLNKTPRPARLERGIDEGGDALIRVDPLAVPAPKDGEAHVRERAGALQVREPVDEVRGVVRGLACKCVGASERHACMRGGRIRTLEGRCDDDHQAVCWEFSCVRVERAHVGAETCCRMLSYRACSQKRRIPRAAAAFTILWANVSLVPVFEPYITCTGCFASIGLTLPLPAVSALLVTLFALRVEKVDGRGSGGPRPARGATRMRKSFGLIVSVCLMTSS